MKTQRKKAQMFSAVFAFQLPSNAAWKVLERSHDGLCKDHSKAKPRGPLGPLLFTNKKLLACYRT
jgi:hypothetical protein